MCLTRLITCYNTNNLAVM